VVEVADAVYRWRMELTHGEPDGADERS
jgi:hypothetical protein